MKRKLKVAVAEFRPLVIEDEGHLRGFEIDLWYAIARMIGYEFEFSVHTLKGVLALLSRKKVDVGLAGITIRESREKVIDFSHPTLDSGLLITVNHNRNKMRLGQTVRNIISEGHNMLTSVMVFFIFFVVTCAHILWVVEKSAHTFSDTYVPGIFEALWLVFISMSTVGYGDFVPQTWLGRGVIMCIILMGAVTFGFVVAQISAFLAVKKSKGEINNSRDLLDKKVAIIDGSSSGRLLKRVGAHVDHVANAHRAYEKLRNEEVDAVVVDAPVAIYYEKHDHAKVIEIVGEIIDKQQYSIALQQNSELREEINQAILKLQESGQYDVIYRKWFGDDHLMQI
jgi:ABC-type amino acid transport substrate-binding protein